jgi:hypothetical protein
MQQNVSHSRQDEWWHVADEEFQGHWPESQGSLLRVRFFLGVQPPPDWPAGYLLSA